jgi:hypothetical protein
MAYSENFLGMNGFIWFVGVVEDRNDPLKAGRVRVRILGTHTEVKEDLPTSDLPWATCLLPTTSAGISGLGEHTFLVEGSWVFGYFKDGMDRQDPMIMGSIPGIPGELGNPNVGYNDPNRRSDIESEDDYNVSVYPRLSEVDTNRLAVNGENEHSSLTTRKANRITGIATADFNPVIVADESEIPGSDSDTFDQPSITYNAVYPYNHVFESESGHIREYDDSFTIDENGIRTNFYRIHERHTSGTAYEIDNGGNKTNLIVGDQFTNVKGKDQNFIEGNSDTTINGRHKLFINKDGNSNNNYDIQIGPNANINIQVDKGNINMVTVDGNINVNSGGDYNLRVAGNYTQQILGNELKTVEGSSTQNTTQSVTIRGSTIDLNP